MNLQAQQSSYIYDQSGNVAAIATTGSSLPTVETQPQTQLFQVNSSISFSVIAAGVGLSYQWLSNGVPILGANSDTLYLPKITGTNGSFSVIICNDSGCVTSTPAVIWANSNGNGIPDWWEMEYFGNLNQKADGDYDGDGVDNLDEYLEGTDPANPNSYDPRLYLQGFHGSIVASPDQPYYTMGQIVTLTAVPDAGQTFISWGGSISGTQPVISLIMNSHKTVSASFGLPLPIALDNTNLTWITGGSVPWFGQTEISEDGVGAAQSGLIGGGQQSWFQTVANLSQPMQIGFWWNVSSQPPDGLSFSVDGITLASISGAAIGWQYFQTNLTSGIHTLLWTYSKGANDYPTGIPFSDAAWVGDVSITPPVTQANAPSLSIILANTNTVVIFWPAPSTGFILQQNSFLQSTNWTNVTNPINVVGEQNQVITSLSTSNQFYRLIFP
jgi:hypothetical protein